MGLFVRREDTDSSHLPLYSIGMTRSVLVVGLGNPGAEYALTRHNIGFYCLDNYAEKQELKKWSSKKELRAEITIQHQGATRVIFAKPTTFMNDSGQAVQAIQNFYKILPEDTLIVHDELDLDFGQIRTRNGGGSAGNNGLKSIIEHGGENTARIRIGIHNSIASKAEAADFVLGKFTKGEQAKLPALSQNVGEIIAEYLHSGQLPHETRNF